MMQRLEQTVGPLPKDYKEFITLYGAGTIDYALFVYGPESLADPEELAAIAMIDGPAPFPVFPRLRYDSEHA